MDAVVQFIRNALCTLKNFNAFGDTFLYDPKVTAQFYRFPAPLDETTPLEILIGMTQLYACISVSIAGFGLITRLGIWKLQLINRLVNARAKIDKEESENKKKSTDDDKKNSASEAVARRIVTESLLKEADSAMRCFFVGMNVLAIGVAFFWLFANSFHVTATDWIGGLPALIHALTVMEVALVYLLYLMIKDGASAVRKSYQMKEFASKISGPKLPDAETITAEQYSWILDGWSPFWAGGSSGSAIDVAAEVKMLVKEEESIASRIGAISKKVDEGISTQIRMHSRKVLFEGYREYLYFFLNFGAFYGYLVCILVYYFQNEKTQPEYIRVMLFNMPNAEADWLGNAVGDFMWTIEPIVILMSPMLLNTMIPKASKKEKVA